MSVPRAFLRFSGKVHFSTRLANSESSKAKVLKIKNLSQDSGLERKTHFKNINRENKLLFGALLETKKERDKRISKQNCGTESSLKTDATVEGEVSDDQLEKESEAKCSSGSSKKSSVKGSKEKSGSGKKGKKKKNEDKGTEILSAKETYLKTAENATEVGPSPKLPPPQMLNELQNGNELVSEEQQTNSENVAFPLENKSKPELLIEPDSEIIVGRTITKSDGFYKYPSVTRILNLTMSEASKSALLRWRNGLIAEMGEEKFQEFHTNQLHLGSVFHSNLQEYLQLVPRNMSVLDPELEGCWKSLNSVFKSVSDVKLLESHVVHEELRYRGVIDCIAMYRDSPLIIEWKKSGKPKYTIAMTYDAPLQLSAYIGALNFDSSYPFKVSKGLVVVAYSDGTPANVFPLSASQLRLHWKAWMDRYKKFTDMVHIETAGKEVSETDKKEEILSKPAVS